MNSVQRIDAVGERGCVVCAKHRGEIVIPGGSIYQDEFLYVCRRAPPGEWSDTYLGYVLVETGPPRVGDSGRPRAYSRWPG